MPEIMQAAIDPCSLAEFSQSGFEVCHMPSGIGGLGGSPWEKKKIRAWFSKLRGKPGMVLRKDQRKLIIYRNHSPRPTGGFSAPDCDEPVEQVNLHPL